MAERYVFSTRDIAHYRFPTHVNDLVLDRAEAAAAEVFIVVLEPGEAPPLHVHDDTEQIFYVLEGAGKLYVGPEEELQGDIRPGDVVRIPPSTLHRVRCQGDTRLRYLSVDCFPGGRPAEEPTWDSHVRGVCQANGWDYTQVRRPDAAG